MLDHNHQWEHIVLDWETTEWIVVADMNPAEWRCRCGATKTDTKQGEVFASPCGEGLVGGN